MSYVCIFIRALSRPIILVIDHISILLYKANRPYLLICKVSRYCLSALHGSIVDYIDLMYTYSLDH